MNIRVQTFGPLDLVSHRDCSRRTDSRPGIGLPDRVGLNRGAVLIL